MTQPLRFTIHNGILHWRANGGCQPATRAEIELWERLQEAERMIRWADQLRCGVRQDVDAWASAYTAFSRTADSASDCSICNGTRYIDRGSTTCPACHPDSARDAG